MEGKYKPISPDHISPPKPQPRDRADSWRRPIGRRDAFDTQDRDTKADNPVGVYRKRDDNFSPRAGAKSGPTSASPWAPWKRLFAEGHYTLEPNIETHRTDDPDWQQNYPDWTSAGLKDEKQLHNDHVKYLKDRKGITIGKELGRGAYGRVYLCEMRRNGEVIQLACKVQCIGNFAKKPLSFAVNILCHEADIYTKLDHPNIVKRERVIHIYDHKSPFPKPTHVLFFMELMDGDLKSQISRGSKEKDIHYWFIQIVRGLRYLHDMMIAHLDIKPDNILYVKRKVGADKHMIYKLTDFGVAKQFLSNQSRCVGLCGTLRYMAPELLSGNPWQLKPADMYALGVSLARCMNARSGAASRVIKVCRYQTADVRTILGISQQLAHLIANLTETDVSTRLTIEEVCDHPWVTTAFPDNDPDLTTRM